MGTRKISEDQIKQVYRMYEDKRTPTEIALQLKISNTSVRNIIKVKYPNCDMNYGRKKHFVDLDYFKKIDTERKAYFLGLMYADGAIVRQKNIISTKIALVEEDNSILKVFKEELNTSYSFYEYKRSKLNPNWKDVTEFRISRTEFSNHLINAGCGFKKSDNLRFPDLTIVPINLRSHFIRGYFDGDGSICINKSKQKRVVRFEGTLEFLLELQKHFAQTLSLPFTVIQKRHKDRPSNAYTLQYYGTVFNRNCGSIGDYLYKDASVFLQRKYQRFQVL